MVVENSHKRRISHFTQDTETYLLKSVTLVEEWVKYLTRSAWTEVPMTEIAISDEQKRAEKFARQIAIREREGRAVRLRQQGLTYADIARELGVSEGAGYKICQRALQRLVDGYRVDGDKIRALELGRLDVMTRKMMEQLEAQETPIELVQSAVTKLIQIMERRACYLGLDQPFEPLDEHEESRRAYKAMVKAATTEELEELRAMHQAIKAKQDDIMARREQQELQAQYAKIVGKMIPTANPVENSAIEDGTRETPMVQNDPVPTAGTPTS
jgi:hypothetical protein